MRFFLGILSALAIVVLAGLIVLWTGAYNVAASAGHTGFGRWVLDTMMEQSVKSRADDSDLSAEMVRTADLRAGFREFQEYCVHCHGAPGVQAHEWTRGMTPEPPELSQVAADWTPAQIFWIAKNGIKMTGMPAFGDSESDETIRNIAAFVDRMEGMTPERYGELQAQWGSSEGDGQAGHDHGSHEH